MVNFNRANALTAACPLELRVMPLKIRCLDLFCCGGGAGMGYHQAGFDVVGVDIAPQPKYPFNFVQGDALEYLAAHGHEFDFIHASPPCQGYSHLTPAKNKGDHERMIPAVRELMIKIGKPWVIENVAGARKELLNPVMLCGSMFGLRTQRHRFFETSHPVTAPSKCDHSEIPLLVTTASKASRKKRFALGMQPKTVSNAPAAYGIDWMGFSELKEAIPPAYTRYLGEAMMGHNPKLTGELMNEVNEASPAAPAAMLSELLCCGRCSGNGYDPEIVNAVCCGAACSAWECGGSGCSGPDPEPTPCRDCGGSGKAI